MCVYTTAADRSSGTPSYTTAVLSCHYIECVCIHEHKQQMYMLKLAIILNNSAVKARTREHVIELLTCNFTY
jgi:hypothetical protein